MAGTFRTTGPTELPPDDYALLREQLGSGVEFTRPSSSIWGTLLPLLLPVGLLILFFWWMQRRAQGQMGGIMSIGRSRAKTYSTERPATTFEDVAGYEGVKREITEVVNFLREPEKFARIGARIPKGILLVGPPGTGKTLIARAVAGEAGVPFLSVTGSDFMEMFVGVGASRVRDLFSSARKMGRAIIFIDEIDSIGRKRGAGLGGGHDEREQTLNQMLSEMDGFEATEGIVMMAATNRPDILDPALLRPGRFDRQVVVPLPELEDRVRILEVHVKGKKMSDDLDLALVARGTPGMSGADLSNVVNEAALAAVRDGEETIAMAHFEQARDRVLIGQKRESLALSTDEKTAVAYHEAGHAVCAATLPSADPLHKVTVIPSGMALGVTMQLPEQERHIYRQNYIEDSLVVRMGGRIAEELVFGVISTGANDGPGGRHATGPQDGPRVGHERSPGTDGLGCAQRGLPGRGDRQRTRVQRTRRRASSTRRWSASSATRSSAAGSCCGSTAMRWIWWHRRCSSTRRFPAARCSDSSRRLGPTARYRWPQDRAAVAAASSLDEPAV